jgi:site-specific recombinase XerD
MDVTRLLHDVLADAHLLISDVVSSTESKRAYKRAIRELMEWCGYRQETVFDKALINRYRSYLISRKFAPATINQKLSAIRALAIELGDNGTLPATTATAISRVKGVKSHGTRIGRWLNPTQAETLLDAPDKTTLKGKRDHALLAVTIGCGLRRLEVAGLTVATIQERSDRWMLVDVRGKHGRIRSVPMPPWAKDAVDEWLTAANIHSGCIFRAINKLGCVHGGGISAQTVYAIITGYGVDIGVDVAPHDLRRSFARLAHSGKSPLEQIQLSLGHASVATTERYIGVRQNLIDAPCDRLGIVLPSDALPLSDDQWFVTEFPPGISSLLATGLAPACGDYSDLFRSLCGEDVAEGAVIPMIIPIGRQNHSTALPSVQPSW